MEMDSNNSISRRTERTPEEIARLGEVRAKFQREKPTMDSLLASGEYSGPMKQGDVLAMLTLAAQIKALRQSRQLSLADVAARSGIDKAQFSRIENGLNANPTLATLETIIRSLGARLRFFIEDPQVAQKKS
jgi:DNA-binding Xre family transcriptional regulator